MRATQKYLLQFGKESQKYETWKTTWGLFIGILIKGPSIKENMRKICVMLTVFYSNN